MFITNIKQMQKRYLEQVNDLFDNLVAAGIFDARLYEKFIQKIAEELERSWLAGYKECEGGAIGG